MKSNERKEDITGLATKICIWKVEVNCEHCNLDEILFCRPKPKYAFLFAIPLLIAIIPTVIGILFFSGINGIWKIIILGIWFAYGFFFLNIWESQMLCNHCPYYANDSEKYLRCPIDRGKLKTGSYDPGPTSLSEKIQFIIGTIILIGYPLPFLIIENLWIFLIFWTIGIISWIFTLQVKVCKDCVNFACPLNRVPKSIRDDFFKRNPVIRKAWEQKGYKIEN